MYVTYQKMTYMYTIKFVNFTLGALFQNNLGRWGGCSLSALYMYGSYTPMGATYFHPWH